MHKHLQMTKLTANIKHTFLSFQANCYCNFGCFGVIPFLKGLRVFIENLNRSLILLNRVKDTRQERLTFNFFVNNFRQIQYIVLCFSVPSLVFSWKWERKKRMLDVCYIERKEKAIKYMMAPVITRLPGRPESMFFEMLKMCIFYFLILMLVSL